jgi:hypothetical protein
MPREGATIFSDLIGKLDVLRVSCDKCGRDGCYGLGRLMRVLISPPETIVSRIGGCVASNSDHAFAAAFPV